MNIRTQTLKSIAHLGGGILSTIALAAFAFALLRLLTADGAAAMLHTHWGILFPAFGLYALTFLPMVFAWIVLARVSGIDLPQGLLARIFLISQIGKYLPGNFGHLLGRAYLARRSGVAIGTTAIAMTLELAGVLTAACILAGAAAALGMVGERSNLIDYLAGLAALVSLSGSLMLVRWRIGPIHRSLRPLLFALGSYLSVFALLAAMNVGIVATLSDEWSWPLACRVSGALIVSWLIGFVTPGAPAGIGLREVSFVALLAGTVPQEVAILAAAGFRLTSIAGDGLAWLMGLAIRTGEAPLAIEV